MKKHMMAGLFCILTSIILAIYSEHSLILSFFKCCTLAIGITILTYGFTQPHLKYKNTIVYGIGIILLAVYVIIAFDTYIMHTLPVLAGIIRYPMFSMYGMWYLVFCIIGVMLSFKKVNEH